jgi:D-cysteine desulfhydrase/L-cysteate sulfo-lyase
MLFGLRALGSPVRVTGICVRRDAVAQRPRIRARCDEIAELLGLGPVVGDDDIVLDDAYLAPGYGQLNEAAVRAIKTAAECEALILDPVYTAKTMAGFLDRAQDSAKAGGADRSLLFIHTGGTPAAFGYVTALTEALA